MRLLLLTLALLIEASAPSAVVAAEPSPVFAPAPTPGRQTATSQGRRLALVVGTRDYSRAEDWQDLPNARTDADAFASELARRYGYEVTRLADPDTGTFKRALVALSAAAGPSDDVVVFVAGHGWFDADDKAGYLVFADGEAGCSRGCYPLDNVKRALFDSRARHVLVMLDACYAGTFDIRVALGGATDRGALASDPASLRRVLDDYAQYPSRLVLASIGKEPTTDGPRGAHSPFMARVLGALSRPGPSGVVSLDQLWGALQATGPDGPLRVGRPAPFEAARPHHPNGTFLFIADVGFCEAAKALSQSGWAEAANTRDGFGSLRAGPARQSVWGTAWSAAWTLPGAASCDVWRWETDGTSQLRCDLGAMSEAVAVRHAPLVLADLRACFTDADGWTEQTGETHGSESLPDVRRAHTQGRAVALTTTCADDCTMSLVFE
jgi:hypothetical protein